MSGLSSSLRRLEQRNAHRGLGPSIIKWNDALDAVEDGRGTLEDLRWVLGEEVQETRIILRPLVPLLVAGDRLGVRLKMFDMDPQLTICCRPPNEPLDTESKDQIVKYRRWIRDIQMPNRGSRRFREFVDRRLNMVSRYLLFGDEDALQWRRTLWHEDLEGWKLRPDVLLAAETERLDEDRIGGVMWSFSEPVTSLLGLIERIGHVSVAREGHKAETRSADYVRSVIATETARHGLPDWSKQVI